VLAVPDAQQMRADPGHYQRLLLSNHEFSGILQAINRGLSIGVFSAQLHGMEHYWPEALMTCAERDERIRNWLTQDSVPRTEDLPAALQSRWTDATVLPSRSLPRDDIEAAVKEEIETFAAIFGQLPRVVVPPTFVWDETVETAWAAGGVQVVVTPGLRYEGRDLAGAPGRAGPRIYNGDMAKSNLVYVVRDEYFEPALGHRAERGLEALARKTRAGRPTLLEMHRFNFIDQAAHAERAVAELERLLALILDQFPDVLFMSTLELAEGIGQIDPEVIEQSTIRRLHFWLARLSEVPRIGRLAWLTGIIVPAWLLFLVTKTKTDRVTAAYPG
jgi:hypothetical protein